MPTMTATASPVKDEIIAWFRRMARVLLLNHHSNVPHAEEYTRAADDLEKGQIAEADRLLAMHECNAISVVNRQKYETWRKALVGMSVDELVDLAMNE